MSIVNFNFRLVESLIAPLNNKFQEELEYYIKLIYCFRYAENKRYTNIDKKKYP